MTTTDILHELRSPDNFISVEWNHPETVPQDERERIAAEAEQYRHEATEEEVEELIDVVMIADAGTPLEAASWFLDLSADHGVYQTVSVILKKKP